MKINQKSQVNHHQTHELRFAPKLMSAIAVGAIGAMTFSAAHAQETSSHIFGKAPADSTVTVHSDTGINRHGVVGSNGRYNLPSLPPGTYLVSLVKDGKTVASLPNVGLFVGPASEVDFACDGEQCSAVRAH
jgi:hypothetical protein